MQPPQIRGLAGSNPVGGNFCPPPTTTNESTKMSFTHMAAGKVPVRIPTKFASTEAKRAMVAKLADDLAKAKTDDEKTSAANRLAKARWTTVERVPKGGR